MTLSQLSKHQLLWVQVGIKKCGHFSGLKPRFVVRSYNKKGRITKMELEMKCMSSKNPVCLCTFISAIASSLDILTALLPLRPIRPDTGHF